MHFGVCLILELSECQILSTLYKKKVVFYNIQANIFFFYQSNIKWQQDVKFCYLLCIRSKPCRNNFHTRWTTSSGYWWWFLGCPLLSLPCVIAFFLWWFSPSSVFSHLCLLTLLYLFLFMVFLLFYLCLQLIFILSLYFHMLTMSLSLDVHCYIFSWFL